MVTPFALTSAAAPADADAPPRPVVLWAVALAGAAGAATSAVLVLRSDHVSEPGVRAALVLWVVLPYIFAGVVAWWRRPESRFGPLLVAAGFAFFLSSLSTANGGVGYTIGIAFDLVPAVLFLHVFWAFPTGRLESKFEQGLVAVGYFVAFGLQLVGLALGGFGSDNLLELTSEPGAAQSLLRVQLVVLAGCALAGIGVLAVRRRTTGPPLRRSLALLVDSFALGLLMIAFLLLSGALGLVEGQHAFENIRRTTFFVIGLAPFAFLIGLFHARLARTSVGELLIRLRADPAPMELRDALARALRDPSLELVYWLPEFGSYADLDGRAVTLAGDTGERATTPIVRDGVRVAALIHDPLLKDEPELLNAVTAAAGIALENARLQVELRAKLEELAGSRARVLEAGQKERRDLERNLHDGAQKRLIDLSLELRLLEKRLGGDPVARSQLKEAQREVTMALEELRTIARGIHPAVLTGHGLGVALEQVAARTPVPVRLCVDLEERLPEPVEVAAYYVVTESLANVAKHAQATTANVEIDHAADELVVEVVDDGVGGADSEQGSGLRGLADRVEALGGRLRVWTPSGGGTRVRAEIPCG